VPPLATRQDVPNRIPRSVLNRIIGREVEILEMVRDRLNVVSPPLVSGGSSLPAAQPAERPRRAARASCARNVRLGRPLGISGLPEIFRGPAHSAVAGMLIYPQFGGIERAARNAPAMRATGTGGGYFGRVGRWFKESF
jgi:cell division protein FtsA